MKASLQKSDLFGLMLAGFITLLSACSGDPGTGPAAVKWDRDACARCRMVVSEHAFAAEVRGGPKRQVFKFDDLGCAVLWLEEQPWKDETSTEIWVADFRSGSWLDARKARYVVMKNTPMDYGLGAVADAMSGSIEFAEARERIFVKEEQYRTADQQHRETGLHATTNEIH